jgi:hypothetical protein
MKTPETFENVCELVPSDVTISFTRLHRTDACMITVGGNHRAVAFLRKMADELEAQLKKAPSEVGP